MKNFNLLRKSERKSVGTTLALTVGSPSFDRRYSRLKHLAFMLLFLLGSLNVWGDNILPKLYLKSKNTPSGDTGWTFTNAACNNAKADYWKMTQSASEVISPEFNISEYTSVTVKVKWQNFGGFDTSKSNATIEVSTALNTWKTIGTTGLTVAGTTTVVFDNVETSSSYSKAQIKISTPNADGSVGGRLFSVEVIGEPAAGGCDKKVTISAGMTTNGTFDLSKTGEAATCDAAVEVTVTPHPAEHFEVDEVTASNDGSVSGPNGEGEYTVTYAQNYNNSSEINVTFKQKDQYTVTWNNHGLTSESQVYEGEKPVFPETPASCDATSTTFIGWATAHWDGKIANLNEKTVYTSAAEMPAVTGPVEYFAVFAKVAGESGWIETAIGDLGASDVFVIVGSNGSTYAMTNDKGANSAPVASAVTIANSKITSDVADNIKWNISGNATDGYTFYPNGDSESWLYCTNTNNGVRVGTNTNKTFTIADGYLKHSGTSRYVGIYNSQDWRCYTATSTNINNQAFNFYKYSAGSASDYMTTCAAEGTCEAPSFSPVAGTFDEAQDITLKTSTPSAHIYYTLDGTDPDNGSAKYSTPIHITQNTTIKAITYADGLTKSSISTGVFNIRYAQPTFSLAAGEYTTAQNVIISADGAEHIYYTINGDDPIVDPANLYDGSAIAINTTGSHTIKAIAVKAGYANSNVASATYVMDLPYGSIAEFVTAKPNTAKDLVFEEADNCVITGINGNSVYVQDASGKGMIIFNKSGYGALEFHVGDRIVGTVNGKYQAFNGQHEMSLAVFAEGVTFTAVSRPTPVPVTAIDETAFNANTQILVKIEDLYYKSSSDKTHKFATAGGSTEYTIYDQFGIMSGKTMPETSVACNLTGILSVFNTTYQLLPVFATDIVADADAAAPTVNPAGGADAENAVTAAAVEITAATGTKVDESASKTVDINSTTPTEVTVKVTRDFYRPVNYSCGWYKAAAAKYNINGQDETTEGTVVAKVAGVEAATAAEGDEVHVFITPNAHFHLATILVNDGAIATTMVSEGAEYSFEMPGEAVTIAVTWTEDAKYALTFTAGEGSGDAPAISGNEYYAGEVIQLPANTFTYDAQHKFTKWLIGGTEYAAGANYTMPAAPAEAVAQWKTIPAFASGDWILVKDAAELSEGSYVIIASANAKVAMKSYASGNNCKGKGDAEKSGDLLTYDSDYGVFEIGDYEISEVTYKTFFDVETEQYLFLGTDNNYLKAQNAKDANAAWTITSVSSEGVAVVTSKSYNTRKMRYNSNSTLFACYTGGQGDIVFYKYHVPSLKLSYDANAGGDAVTNLPGMQIADGENKVTVSSETPLRENYIFNGWKDGESNDHAAGDVITLSENMTLYAQWRTPETYSISYDANGGTLIEGESEITPNPTSVTEGNAYTIEENVYEVEGKLFIGWKANGVTYNAGQVIYPTENMTFVAQWGDPNVTDFMLVTDVKQLKDGDKVYIVAADYNVAMGTQNDGNYRNYVEIAKQNNRVVILNATPVEFTVGKDGDNFTFKDGEDYLYASSSDKNYLITKDVLDDNGKWAITINANGVASIIAQGANTHNDLKWNNSSPRFSCYASGQKAVSIYKRPDYSRNVSGNYATICLPKAGQIIGATLYEIAYYGEASKKIFFDEIVNGEMEAGIPYIFQPAAGVEKINVYYSDNTAEDVGAGNRNGLIGFYDLNNENATLPLADNASLGNYILYQNAYWLVSGRAAYIANYRAYIRLNQITPSEPTLAPGRRRISMSVNDTQTTTGFENAEANEAPRKVLINGELFILRGEKMYDAKGQLVK